jgi:D-alanyl-D-alanine carboxypeptidase
MFHHVAIGHTMNGASAEIAPAASGWHALLLRALALFAVLALAAGCATTSEPIQTMAPAPGSSAKYSALVIDAASGDTLYQANATATRYPASLTKMMTL